MLLFKVFTSFFARLNFCNLKLRISKSVCTCTEAHSLPSRFIPYYHSEAQSDVAQRHAPEEWNSQPQCCGALKSPAYRTLLHLTLNWSGLSPLRSGHPCLLDTRRAGVLAVLITSWYLIAKRSVSEPHFPWKPYFHLCVHNDSPLIFITYKSTASHHILKTAF